MNDFILYIKESYNELLHKVTWPTWPELMESSKLVLVGSVIIALIVLVFDFIWKTMTGAIYSLTESIITLPF